MAFISHTPLHSGQGRGLVPSTCQTRPGRNGSKTLPKRKGPRVIMQLDDDYTYHTTGQDDDGTQPASSYYYSTTGGGGGDNSNNNNHNDDDVTVDAKVRTPSMSELKSELYAAVSTANRGFLMTTESRRGVECTIEELERLNPAPNATEAVDILMGNWRLLYTNALDVLSLGLLSPIALVNQVYQNILPSSDSTRSDFDVENVVELEPTFSPVSNAFVGRTMAKLVVQARAQRQSDSNSVVGLTIDNVSFRPQTLFGAGVPPQIRSPNVPLGRRVGSLDTTFLDDDLRVSRAVTGGGKNVFVLAREPY